MNNIGTQLKHFVYTCGCLSVYSFGLILLNQSQELNRNAEVLATLILLFTAYLAYELVTTKDYKMMPLLMFAGAVATMIGLMCLYGG